MNKKLPKIYQGSEKINNNNNNYYYSYKNVEPTEETIKLDNFFKYFNKSVEITTTDNKIINTKILSKRENKLLLEDGTYVEMKNLKNIK